MVVVECCGVEGWIVNKRHARDSVNRRYGMVPTVYHYYGQLLLPRMVAVESCGVEGWFVSERHAVRQRELEEPLCPFLFYKYTPVAVF
jgi:hypothetical protein